MGPPLAPEFKANAAMAKEGLAFSALRIRKVENERFKERALALIWRAAAFAGLRSSEVTSTEIIGATDAMVNMPKPSVEFTAVENPIPILSTNGTVTGPVVTPALRGGGGGERVSLVRTSSIALC